MKRDMELVRQILMVTEEQGRSQGWLVLGEEDAPGKTPEEIAYHVKLLHDAGFVEAVDMSHQQGLVWHPKRLTWAGHEFLDAVRNDTVWARTKKVIADKGGSMPFEMVRELVMVIARQYFLDQPPSS